MQKFSPEAGPWLWEQLVEYCLFTRLSSTDYHKSLAASVLSGPVFPKSFFHIQQGTRLRWPSPAELQLSLPRYTHTAKQDEYFNNHDIPSPTFNVSSLMSFRLSDNIAESKDAVLEATDELQMLILGPIGFQTSLHVLCALHSKSNAY